jgi:hypothetical protein
MTILSALSAVSTKSLRLPTVRMPKWLQFKPGPRISDATQMYTRAISTSYLVALGLNPDTWQPRERTGRGLDY